MKLLSIFITAIFSSMLISCGTNLKSQDPSTITKNIEDTAKVVLVHQIALDRNLRHEVYLFDDNEKRFNVQLSADENPLYGALIEVPPGNYAVSGILFFFQGNRILFDGGTKAYKPFNAKKGHLNIVIGPRFKIIPDKNTIRWRTFSTSQANKLIRKISEKYKSDLPINIIKN